MGFMEHFKTLIGYELALFPHAGLGVGTARSTACGRCWWGGGEALCTLAPVPYMKSQRVRVHFALERVRCPGVLATFQKLSSDQGY